MANSDRRYTAKGTARIERTKPTEAELQRLSRNVVSRREGSAGERYVPWLNPAEQTARLSRSSLPQPDQPPQPVASLPAPKLTPDLIVFCDEPVSFVASAKRYVRRTPPAED